MGYALNKLETVNELGMTNCYSCGTPFGVEKQLMANLRENHNTFYCPNGHAQSYVGKSEAEKLREQLSREQTSLAIERNLRLEAENKMNRLKKRVGNGVCPCCKRSFSNLKRHMTCKHPKFSVADVTKIA